MDSSSFLQIDTSKTNYEEEDEDFLKIKLKTDEILQINYSNLIKQSKYFQDKYNYSEALCAIQAEMDEIEDNLKFKDECVKYSILSKYFHITKLSKELISIMKNKLSSNINFSIQILQDSKTTDNKYETDITSEVENFLIAHINECILNPKFGSLKISVYTYLT